MNRRAEEATHDYDAFLDDTPRGFYLTYGIGSALIIAVVMILWVAGFNPIAASVGGFFAVTMLAVMAVRWYSRI
ncbi:MAG: hypothetical protein HYX29_11795 [Solirubrobacterales bacterium]|nr:hypothetical protein [Solirubrobacterales bacterium]